jgi:AraC-like DNA-binding protein
VVASGLDRRETRCTIVDRVRPSRSGEWDATLAAPRIYRPASPLTEHTELIGHWHATVGYRSRALPRGAVTVIIDVGQRQRVDFYAADGHTRLTVPPAFITGSHTASYVSDIAAHEPAMAIHFRPGGAFPFLGIPLSDLENTHVGLDHIWGRDGLELHERLIDAPTIAARFDIVENFLLSRPWSSVHRHPGVAAALAAIEGNPSIRMADIRDLVGLPTKRLIALFRAEVGLSPKAYARIRRLQAALRSLATGSVGGARVAADVGYFDQAHYVREFRSFTGMTPTQYAEQRILLPSHVPVVRHKYPRPLAAACS